MPDQCLRPEHRAGSTSSDQQISASWRRSWVSFLLEAPGFHDRWYANENKNRGADPNTQAYAGALWVATNGEPHQQCPPPPALHAPEGSRGNLTHPLPSAQMRLTDGQMLRGRGLRPLRSQGPLFSTPSHGAVRGAFGILTGRGCLEAEEAKNPI